MAGRPPGSENRDKPFKAALRLAIRETEGEADPLRRVAVALIAKAISGDVAAIRELAERLDGKVPQAVVGDDEFDPIRTITRIERAIVDPHHSDSAGVPAAAGAEAV